MKKNILCLLFVLSTVVFAADDTRLISSAPKEIYGTASQNIRIRLGNGGAGPTGILKALSEDYLNEKSATYSIAWYQDISPNTLKQLKNGVIDIALVYEKAQIAQAIEEGWATQNTPVFNDHFLIVGPITNPSDLTPEDSVTTAFQKISTTGMFLSRDDQSATNVKEQSIWTDSGRTPWTENSGWYIKFHAFPKDALIKAAHVGAYTITDQGTWLSNRIELTDYQIFVRGGQRLINPCVALLSTTPSDDTLDFLTYLKSDRAQSLIAEFGKDRFGGESLFTPANEAIQ